MKNEGGELKVGVCEHSLQIFDETKSAMMSGSQGWCHTKFRPHLAGSSHIPPAPRTKASQNPRWVVLLQTISARCMFQSTVCTASAGQSMISRWNADNGQDSYTPPPP